MTDISQSILELRSELSSIVNFTDEEWEAIRPYWRYRKFESGASILSQGEVTNFVYFQRSGLARSYYTHADGKEFNKSFAIRGHISSSIVSLVTQQPTPFSIQALIDSETLYIEYSRLIDLADRYANWGRFIRTVLEKLVIKKETREADFLMLSAEEQYEKFLCEYGDIAEKIPNYHIASYIGITEVGLSRIRGRMNLT